MSDAPVSSTPPRHAQRVAFVDLLRGWAVIVMIQTHVFNATLFPALTTTVLYDLIKFVDGLVAPSFLFASGLAYAITTRRKANDYLAFGRPLFRQFGRLLLILVIGYVLHIPRFNYHHLAYEASAEAWDRFWQVDVLQCIAVSLLFLQILLLLLRSEGRLYRTVAGATVVILLGTPLMWTFNWWNVLPVPIASYLNGLYYSLFPLFPWSAFLFAGALAGYYYTEARERGAEALFLRRAAYAGLAAIGISFALHPLAALLYPVYDYWRFSPSFVLLRLGIVLLLTWGMFLWERKRGVGISSPVTLIGRESLIVYVTHLMLIYGDFGSGSFASQVGRSYGYPQAILVTALLLGGMAALAYAWERIKKGYPRVKRALSLSFLAGLLLVFFFGPLAL
jgi:uncharacterized membrane protein